MTMPIIIKNRLLLFALLFLVFLSTTSCICFKNYGKFVPNADVTAAFNKSEINPDFTG
jgi:hypothetical protein